MAKKPKHREQIVGAARLTRDEIRRMFLDGDLWNKRARQEGATLIDVDPDGRLRRILGGLNRMLAAEDARPIPPIDGFDTTTGRVH